ncbi:hypothetical protein J5226_07960 [Lysobacter sp. K5869]|uniref:hypothetical protein n=1 Tax=Lysobacter sp. K5869 TaxID=2820808 RepID=UPI001C05F128|nr:hypothetical protein [Lysobacter sp. K5869]QWP78315.1 hypothetical protein J5226_07960 [Lysobacter sp. K5869]
MKEVMFAIKVATLLAASFTTGFTANKALSPQDVRLRVEQSGAPAVVRAIWSSPEKTRQLLSGVSSGDPRWIDVAERLAPGVDAGASEDLDAALAQALLVQPYVVLPWLKRHWWSDGLSVCEFAADSELPPGYLEKLKVALSRKPPKQVAALREECLRGLASSRRPAG